MTLRVAGSLHRYEKQRNLDLQTKLQRQLKRYRELNDPAADQVDEPQASQMLEHSEQLYTSVRDVIDSICGEQPHLKEVLDRVSALLAS